MIQNLCVFLLLQLKIGLRLTILPEGKNECEAESTNCLKHNSTPIKTPGMTRPQCCENFKQ